MDGNLKNLSQYKEQIEKDIAGLRKEINILEETEGFQKGLVDKEGFPRADLDFGKLTQYRTLKKKLNELQTDYSKLMSEVENELFSLHKSFADSGQAQKDIEEYEAKLDKERIEKKQKEIDEMNILLKEKAAQKAVIKSIPVPFSEVTMVVNSSPADKDGLKTNDLITNFGVLNSSNFSEINQIVEVVRNNINLDIPVRLLREVHENQPTSEEFEDHTYKGKVYRVVTATLKPRKWEGEGVLGCKFALIL